MNQIFNPLNVPDMTNSKDITMFDEKIIEYYLMYIWFFVASMIAILFYNLLIRTLHGLHIQHCCSNFILQFCVMIGILSRLLVLHDVVTSNNDNDDSNDGTNNPNDIEDDVNETLYQGVVLSQLIGLYVVITALIFSSSNIMEFYIMKCLNLDGISIYSKQFWLKVKINYTLQQVVIIAAILVLMEILMFAVVLVLALVLVLIVMILE